MSEAIVYWISRKRLGLKELLITKSIKSLENVPLDIIILDIYQTRFMLLKSNKEGLFATNMNWVIEAMPSLEPSGIGLGALQ